MSLTYFLSNEVPVWLSNQCTQSLPDKEIEMEASSRVNPEVIGGSRKSSMKGFKVLFLTKNKDS